MRGLTAAVLALVLGLAALLVVSTVTEPEPRPPVADRSDPTEEPDPPAPQETVPAYPVERSPRTFRVASFNVLGASHTRATGKAPDKASGPVRVRLALRALERARVDVAGLQELEPVQHRALRHHAGRRWAAYPRAGDVRRTIVWQRATWRMVGARTVLSPYFNGHLLETPLVRLRHRATGLTVTFVNVHNPANTRRFGLQEPWRDRATRRQVALMRRLTSPSGLAVITGDMNEHEDYYCAMTRVPGVVAASGGRPARTGSCRPPRWSRIDWIFGGPGLRFTDYERDWSPLVQRASDHALVSATARLPEAARG